MRPREPSIRIRHQADTDPFAPRRPFRKDRELNRYRVDTARLKSNLKTAFVDVRQTRIGREDGDPAKTQDVDITNLPLRSDHLSAAHAFLRGEELISRLQAYGFDASQYFKLGQASADPAPSCADRASSRRQRRSTRRYRAIETGLSAERGLGSRRRQAAGSRSELRVGDAVPSRDACHRRPSRLVAGRSRWASRQTSAAAWHEMRTRPQSRRAPARWNIVSPTAPAMRWQRSSSPIREASRRTAGARRPFPGQQRSAVMRAKRRRVGHRAASGTRCIRPRPLRYGIRAPRLLSGATPLFVAVPAVSKHRWRNAEQRGDPDQRFGLRRVSNRAGRSRCSVPKASSLREPRIDSFRALIDADVGAAQWNISAKWPRAQAGRAVSRTGGCVHKVIRWRIRTAGALHQRRPAHEGGAAWKRATRGHLHPPTTGPVLPAATLTVPLVPSNTQWHASPDPEGIYRRRQRSLRARLQPRASASARSDRRSAGRELPRLRGHCCRPSRAQPQAIPPAGHVDFLFTATSAGSRLVRASASYPADPSNVGTCSPARLQLTPRPTWSS